MTNQFVSEHIVPAHFIEDLALSADFLSTRDICQLSQSFKDWLKDVFIDNDISALLSARAVFVDAILNKLWCQHHLDEYQISLVAVGGYGRGELHPQSDVDILLLTQEDINLDLEEKNFHLYYPALGYQTRHRSQRSFY